MATIYRIAIEQQALRNKDDGRKSTGTSDYYTTGKTANLLGGAGPRGGVEHNRRLRAINPVLNKATHGYWEKGMRIGRAGIGVVNDIKTKGLGALAGVGATIIIAFALQTIMKWWENEQEKARKLNAQNYKALENGVGAIHSAYDVEVNFWTGRQTYNQNK